MGATRTGPVSWEGGEREKALPKGRGQMSKRPSWVSTVHSTVTASGLCGRGWHLFLSSLQWCLHQHTYLALEGCSVPRPLRAPAISTLLHSSSWEMGVTQRET